MSNHVEIRKCRGHDIKAMRGKLRREDVIEIERRTGRDPYTVLVDSYRRSEVSFVALYNGEVACAWGVARESILAEESLIWLLSTPVMTKAPVLAARRTKHELKKLLDVYPKLMNYVDSEYKLCVRWLRWLGFTVESPQPVGIRGGMFSRFYIAVDAMEGV